MTEKAKLRKKPGEGKTVALVLGSGGARGYAHMGVIEVLQEQGYEITAISGASMGALIGGLYATGKMHEYKDWVTGLGQFDLLKLLDFSFGSPGAIRGEKVFGVIEKMLGDTRIEDLSIPYTAVATDLLAHKEIWFQEGTLHHAIRASAAIPSVLTPVMMHGRVLVDGGLLNPLPIIPAVAAHADMIVAVNLAGFDRRYQHLPPLGQWADEESLDKKKAEGARESQPKESEAQPENWHGRHTGSSAAASDEKDKADDSTNPDEWLDKLKQGAARWFDWDSGDESTAKTGSNQTASSEEEALVRAQAREAMRNAQKGDGEDSAHPVSLQELGLGKFDVMNLAVETMQYSLTRYKIAGYPPDVLINFPKHVCKSFDYHKAPEIIQLGRMLAEDALAEFQATE